MTNSTIYVVTRSRSTIKSPIKTIFSPVLSLCSDNDCKLPFLCINKKKKTEGTKLTITHLITLSVWSKISIMGRFQGVTDAIYFCFLLVDKPNQTYESVQKEKICIKHYNFDFLLRLLCIPYG